MWPNVASYRGLPPPTTAAGQELRPKRGQHRKSWGAGRAWRQDDAVPAIVYSPGSTPAFSAAKPPNPTRPMIDGTAETGAGRRGQKKGLPDSVDLSGTLIFFGHRSAVLGPELDTSSLACHAWRNVANPGEGSCSMVDQCSSSG
jgi:hypothetical protein